MITREDLTWAMQKTLLSECEYNGLNLQSIKEFIINEATYEQLLNLVYNPHKNNKYYSREILENIVNDTFNIACKFLKEENNSAIEYIEQKQKEQQEEERKRKEQIEKITSTATDTSIAVLVTTTLSGFGAGLVKAWHFLWKQGPIAKISVTAMIISATWLAFKLIYKHLIVGKVQKKEAKKMAALKSIEILNSLKPQCNKEKSPLECNKRIDFEILKFKEIVMNL